MKDSRGLARHIAMMAPGSSAKLDILRRGESKTVTVKLGTMPEQRQAKADHDEIGPAGDMPHLGLSLAPANDVAGAGGNGVVVTSVDPKGPAAERGVQSGDIILEVGGKIVANAGDVRNALSKATAGGKHDILMRLKHADATRFVAIPLGTPDKHQGGRSVSPCRKVSRQVWRRLAARSTGASQSARPVVRGLIEIGRPIGASKIGNTEQLNKEIYENSK